MDVVRGQQTGNPGKGNPVKRSSGDGDFVDGKENAIGWWCWVRAWWRFQEFREVEWRIWEMLKGWKMDFGGGRGWTAGEGR